MAAKIVRTLASSMAACSPEPYGPEPKFYNLDLQSKLSGIAAESAGPQGRG